ncbi:MAG: alpha-glucosidase/alpha-galactosidase [Clostridiales bacterium]|jgi:alpha-galactosidase|nr:alpha-glucosidase/alpha-galactosidase [Clostridiales bacterium]
MKITFIGAGSTVFCKNVLGDCILTPELGEFEIALYDIDKKRLGESAAVVSAINRKHSGKAKVNAYDDATKALKGADFVINAIQVGGYEPCTVSDFEIPKKYGLRQTIADTLGIGGIFRALRTIPVMDGYARVIEKVCPNALFLNYTNPMAMLSGYMQRYTSVKTVGLCHSVQACTGHLLSELKLDGKYDNDEISWKIAGINHMAWLLEIKDKDGKDIYPVVKKAAEGFDGDRVRMEMMRRFGYYNTESSEHTAEYHAWFIKSRYPELIERFAIPLDEYPRRCVNQIEGWKKLREELLAKPELEHTKSGEYGSRIIEAAVTDKPYRIHGNVLNTGLITNLPSAACVEVPVMVDRNGFNPCYVGDLPEQCAALNRTNINVQLLTIKAAVTRKKEDVYAAAYLDPHTAAELSLDDIKSMCDDLFEAHKGWLPEYK